MKDLQVAKLSFQKMMFRQIDIAILSTILDPIPHSISSYQSLSALSIVTKSIC